MGVAISRKIQSEGSVIKLRGCVECEHEVNCRSRCRMHGCPCWSIQPGCEVLVIHRNGAREPII